MGHTVEFSELTQGAIAGANEDAVAHWWCDEDLILAVADGVGERSAGHVASAMALDVVGRELSTPRPDWTLSTRVRPEPPLRKPCLTPGGAESHVPGPARTASSPTVNSTSPSSTKNESA